MRVILASEHAALCITAYIAGYIILLKDSPSSNVRIECADRMCGSNVRIECADRMCGSNVRIECADRMCGSNVRIECADRMCGSNVRIECADRMCGSNVHWCRTNVQNGCVAGTYVQNGGVTDPCAERMC